MQIYKTVDIKSTNRKIYEYHGIHAFLLSMCSPFSLPTVSRHSTFPIYDSQKQRKYHYPNK